MTVAGLALWWRSPEPAPPPPAPASDGTSSPGMTSFAGSRSTAAAPAPVSSKPFIGKDAPFLFRFGAAYLGGFAVGWVWRKSIKAALWVGGVALSLVAVAKYLGMGGADWKAVETQVAEGLNWFQQQASVARHWLSGYLPSGVASVVGLWRGARWK